jgi:hypothetical protein
VDASLSSDHCAARKGEKPRNKKAKSGLRTLNVMMDYSLNESGSLESINLLFKGVAQQLGRNTKSQLRSS